MYRGMVDSVGPLSHQRIIYVNLRSAACNSGSAAKCFSDL